MHIIKTQWMYSEDLTEAEVLHNMYMLHITTLKEVLHNSCSLGTCDLPEKYIRNL